MKERDVSTIMGFCKHLPTPSLHSDQHNHFLVLDMHNHSNACDAVFANYSKELKCSVYHMEYASMTH